MDLDVLLKKIVFDDEVVALLRAAKKVIYPQNRREIIDIVFESDDNESAEIRFDIPGKESYLEGTIARCKNGVAVNFEEPYMRSRDPEAMVIADELPTNKKTFQERFGESFDTLRSDTFAWLKEQELIVIPFFAGDSQYNYLSVGIIPKEAVFFALALADLQGLVSEDYLVPNTQPKSEIFVAPVFRHTYFKGKQVVVHQRHESLHQIFAYNLYPGPSAKKGVYSVLINVGEYEKPQWATLHCSTVRAVTPYECELVIMHEGASGGGKTEMTQDPHLNNGRLLLAHNIDTSENLFIDMGDTCELFPVTDDMGLVHPSKQTGRKLCVEDAEDSWFLRVDHLTRYGVDPKLEALCIEPPESLVFLNIDGKPGATALIWDHIMNSQDTPCPNPRIILPRKYIPNIHTGSVEVDIRSFGVRAPRCTKENPTYGIFGMLQVLPPALAWLWRLVAPRGHANPSIVASGKGLVSEGVGSYWPFAIGERVEQANILLRQIQETSETGYLLIPNQYIGTYHVGFSGQWLSREYVSRRGGVHFKKGKLLPCRCPLLGYSPKELTFNGHPIPKGLLRVEEQIEVGEEAYDKGAIELTKFFKQELEYYKEDTQLTSLGRQIIDVCLNNGSIDDYIQVMPFNTKLLGLD